MDWGRMIQPVPERAILRSEKYFIWGASMVRTADRVCHLLFARWPREKGFDAWVTDSEIAYASARDPLGPYVMGHTVLERRAGFWDGGNTHNASVMEFDGKYYLYYTGNYGDGSWWDHRNHQRCGVAVADHPAGPWRRMDRPVIDVTEGSWDHLMTSSPTVARDDQGRYVLVYKAVSEGPMPFGGNVRVGVATADHPLGPFVKQDVRIFGHPTAKFPTDDNFIWFQEGKFRAIVKDQGNHFVPGEAGEHALVQFESDDGLAWRVAEPALVSRFQYRREDGTVSPKLVRLDQPQVWLENSRPRVLFLAVKEGGDRAGDLSYNIHVPLGQ